jgi:hypothetical protein
VGAAIVIFASIPAYLAAGLALLLGAGWWTALIVLLVTGNALLLLLGGLAAWNRHRDRSYRSTVLARS